MCRIFNSLPRGDQLKLVPDLLLIIQRGNQDVIVCVLNALSNLQRDVILQTVPVIVALLDNASFAVRTHVCAVLSPLLRDGAVQLVSPLQQIIQHGSDEVQISVLGLLLSDSSLVEMLPQVLSLLENGSDRVQRAAGAVLATLEVDDLVKLVPRLQQMMKVANSRVRIEVLGAFRRLPHKESVLVLSDVLALVADSSEDVQSAAAAFLDDAVHADLVPLLRDLQTILQHSDVYGKTVLLGLLENIPIADLIGMIPTLLINLLENASEHGRQVAAALLCKMPGDELVQLVRRLQEVMQTGCDSVKMIVLSVLEKLPREELSQIVPNVLPLLETTYTNCVDTFEIGQIVKRRDKGDSWRLGKVTQLVPSVKVTNTLDDGSSTYTWDNIEADPDHPRLAIAASATNKAAVAVVCHMSANSLLDIVPNLLAIMQNESSDGKTMVLGILTRMPRDGLLKALPDVVLLLQDESEAVRRSAAAFWDIFCEPTFSEFLVERGTLFAKIWNVLGCTCFGRSPN